MGDTGRPGVGVLDEVAGHRLRVDRSPTFVDCNGCYFEGREATAERGFSVGPLLEKVEPVLVAGIQRPCVPVHGLASGPDGPLQGCLQLLFLYSSVAKECLYLLLDIALMGVEEMIRKLKEMQSKIPSVVLIANPNPKSIRTLLAKSKEKEIRRKEFDEDSFFHKEPPPRALMRGILRWTFALVIIYFAISTMASAHGCWTYSKQPISENEETSCLLRGDVEQCHDADLALTGVKDRDGDMFSIFRSEQMRKRVHEERTGLLGHSMLIVYQTSAGAVILTDVVFWSLLVPFMSNVHFRVNLIMACLHSLNAIFLLVDSALNSLVSLPVSM
ncbi:hypothetical protein M5K25_011091 [Dendrobium thyrsiflorum]|uniref:Uncharacterized protein n=1 Tax=Dendrobium thyrsiflorum TaxID=117978 RepID=A0ABD0V1D7_DENTH